MALTLQEFKELDRLTIASGYPDELLAKILPFYQVLRDGADKLQAVDLADTPPALIYRAGSVK